MDFELEGLQHGFLVLPSSAEHSAWGTIRIPVTVLKNGDGPTITLIGGKHGDEYEGPVTLMRLAREITPSEIQGRIILLPCLNLPAVQAQTRLSPVDQVNLNRIFPGDARGSASYQIADYLTNHILPITDIVLDLHAGGKTLNFAPFAGVHFLDDQVLQQKSEALMIAFGAPNSLRMRDIDNRGMLSTQVEKAGRIFVGTKLGGGGTASVESLRIAHTGCLNVMVQAGILQRELQLRSTRMLEMPDDDCFVFSEDTGLLDMRSGVDWDVYRGDTIALVHPADRTGVKPVAYRANRNGILISRHHPGLVKPGDCLAVIAEEVQR